MPAALCKFPFRLDRSGEFEDLILRQSDGQPLKRDASLPALQDAFEGRLDDDDLVLVANTLPFAMLRKLAKYLPDTLDRPHWIGEAALSAAAALIPDARRGQAALIGIDEAAGVIHRIRSLASAVQRFDRRRTFFASEEWASRYALPRMARRDASVIPADDAQAIFSLVP